MDHFEMFLNKCYEGNLSAIAAFLSEGISPDVQNTEGETALQISAANGFLDIAKLLISKGATIDLPNSYGWTPLMHAARYGHIELVAFLIQMRAKVNVSNRLGLRPIDLAAWAGNLTCLKIIIDAGAIIDSDKSSSVIQNDVCDLSPLIAASLQGHDFVVRTLLEKGSAVNQVSPITGLTPLMLAACCACKSTVEILIEFGGDANITDICGRTALDLAGMECREDVIMFLEDLTQPNSRKSSNGIPEDINILRVVRSGDLAQVKSILQLNQSLSNYSDSEDGVTPLMTACMLGFNNIVDLLISSGADLNAQDIINGWTPLMYAVFHRQTETVHLLLDKGVDIDICTANGYTALDLAIHTDSSENNILNSLLAYSESEELLDVDADDNSTVSLFSTSNLTVEQTHSRGDSQPRFRELLGGLSSHLRQFSKSSAVSPTPDQEIFDEPLCDVFDDDVAKASPKKKFLCLSKFYAPNQRFAHLLKEQVVEGIYLPPSPSPKSSVDLIKTICSKKDKMHKSISTKPHFNSLRVPNILRKMKKDSSACSSHIPGNYVLTESLNMQDIGDFPVKSDIYLKSRSSLQIDKDFEGHSSEATSSVLECSALEEFSELSQKSTEVSIGLSHRDSIHLNKSVVKTAAGDLMALLSEGSLGKYAKKFRDQEIDLECFQYLTEDDLDEMGISSFDSRNKLLEIINKLKNS